jgi:predicted ATPase
MDIEEGLVSIAGHCHGRHLRRLRKAQAAQVVGGGLCPAARREEGSLVRVQEFDPMGDVTRYPALELAPEQRRQKTMEALDLQLETLARSSPVLMIVEDARWLAPEMHPTR